MSFLPRRVWALCLAAVFIAVSDLFLIQLHGYADVGMANILIMLQSVNPYYSYLPLLFFWVFWWGPLIGGLFLLVWSWASARNREIAGRILYIQLAIYLFLPGRCLIPTTIPYIYLFSWIGVLFVWYLKDGFSRAWSTAGIERKKDCQGGARRVK
jgi:hypothetical protein